jgi:hypothetical protein
MIPPKNLEKLKGLLETIANREIECVQYCSEVKIQATHDFDGAIDKYENVVIDVLAKQEANESKIDSALLAAKSAMKHGVLQSTFVDALRLLKKSYYETILKPSLSAYLKDEVTDMASIERVYSRAVELDEILEVVKFFKKIDSSSS